MVRNARPNVVVLPGDGIGPEVVAQAVRVLEWFGKNRGFDFDSQHEDFGITTYHRTGRFMREGLMEELITADAVLFGAMGGEADHRAIPHDIRRRDGLLGVRNAMKVFANIRPVKPFKALASASPLRPDLTAGVDMVIVRELTGGMYFGEPRFVETLPDGTRRGVNTHVYTTPEIIRIGRVAFDLARTRRKHVTSVDKANVMESGMMWREEMEKLQREEYPDVTLVSQYVDNTAMQLVKWPAQFDVIVTDNLFGDVLSDEASTIMGSLGMLPSASLSEKGPDGRRRGFYEPSHGSAPDIAGQGKANPIATILSLGMAMEMAFERPEDAKLLEDAVIATVGAGIRTPDIVEPGSTVVSTSQMGDAILAELHRLTN